jgi:curved DNA-binding protein CbpA
MVKVDPTRNYYADLNVSANASENEIRKAFRALALQFHPDRNPGRETQVVVKFQEIQAANEILSDQALRAKYDAERRKYRGVNNTPNTPRTRPPPPPRNTHTTSTTNGSYYRAPPPKPAAQPRPPPPQQYASYTSGADRFTSKNFRTPPTAQRPPDTRAQDAEARANVFTAWQKMKQQPRPPNASPQTKQNGQPNQNGQTPQTNPNGTPFGRSQSTRVPSERKGFNPGTPGGDEGQARSAYRNYARPAPTPPSSTTPPHPNDTPTTQVPYAEGTRTRTPYYSTAAGERTSMFEGLGRSASVRNSPTGANRPNSSADPASYSDSGRRQRNSYGGKPNSTPFPHMYADSSDEESESEVFKKPTQQRGPPASKNPPPPPPPTWSQSGFGTPQSQQSNGAGATPKNFKSRSEESINMKFSPSDWHGKFESSADYFAPNMHKGSSAKGRMSPTRGRPPQRNATERNPPSTQSMGSNPASPFTQSQTQYGSYPIPPPPPGPPPNLNFPPPQAEPDAQAAKFKPEEWANYFKEPSWVFSEQKETSPRRAADTTKRPKAARKGSVAQDKRSRAQDQTGPSPPKKYQATADDAEKGDADAMDIDPSTPPVQAKESVNGQPAAAGTMPNGSTPATKQPIPGLNGVNTALVDDDTFTAPKSNSIGMNSVGDALPFASEPSKTHPTKSNTAQKLKFPNMPLPPALPTTYDQVFVDLYFSRFETYCKDYMKATKAMTTHFVARDAELATNLDDRFAHHRGETTKKLGFASYLARMKEDEQVLETWQVYQQNHIKAMAQCEEVRNRSMKIYQAAVA